VKHVDFFYDFSCPYAYLAHDRVDAACARGGATVTWRPFLLGGVFRAIGTPDSPGAHMPASKAGMNLLDMHRWAAFFGVPFRMPETHPNRTVLALRATMASDDVGRAGKALYAAYWAKGLDVSKPEVVRAALDEAGFDGAALVAKAAGLDMHRCARRTKKARGAPYEEGAPPPVGHDGAALAARTSQRCRTPCRCVGAPPSSLLLTRVRRADSLGFPMRMALRATHRPLRAGLLSAALLAGAFLAPAAVAPQIALAEEDPPVAAGTTIVARADCEIQKVVIARSTRLEITAATPTTVDVALPDGFVLHKVAKARIRYFFDVVR
jgi:2-hydroxychromene-2-carboxylate isomerase